MPKTIQHALMTKSEQRTIGLLLAKVTSYDRFMHFMLDNKLLLAMDWKGEQEKGQLHNFLKTRLTEFDVDFQVNDADIQNQLQIKLQKESQKKVAEIDDYFVELVKTYQKIVSKAKFVIVNFHNGSDTYYIGIIRKTQLTKLKKEFFFEDAYFIKFGEVKGNDALYIIHCQYPDRYDKTKICNAMNMWQLPINSPPNQGSCDACGNALFNETGKPYFDIEVDLI